MDSADFIFQDAQRAGIDLDLIETNLALSPEERLRQHDAALAFVIKLEIAKGERDTRWRSTISSRRKRPWRAKKIC